MAKYNIKESSENCNDDVVYRQLVSPAVMDDLKDRIIQLLVVEKKYKDKRYTARQLATDLGTNTRYVSAVVNVKFHMNYTSLVNKYRIEEAMSILVDKRYKNLRMNEVSDMVGFANRQSFYAAFFRITGVTPREYRLKHSHTSNIKRKK